MLHMPSRVIRNWQYDPGHGWLDITFVSGRRYRYFDVPVSIEQDLAGAASKGATFNRAIRNRYRCERLDRLETCRSRRRRLDARDESNGSPQRGIGSRDTAT
ncbi:KTSC domain-containing protein [Sphingomonas sp. NFR04]|nr:KTSC domain-containing protein [Sphingomonas sp. NFR04]